MFGDDTNDHAQVNLLQPTPALLRQKPPSLPTTLHKQLEAELWSARLGFPSTWQMNVIPEHADGLPSTFHPHPFSKSEFKMSATTSK